MRKPARRHPKGDIGILDFATIDGAGPMIESKEVLGAAGSIVQAKSGR